MMESALTINLEVLSDEDCWLIFSKIAFSNEEELKYLEDLGRKLAIKCNGLPLVAKTLGSLMHNKRNREQWNKILDSHMWELEDIEKGLLAPLLLSYYELPSTMRRCFSYCAIFSKDYLFSRDKLVLHWMAQGYVESKANMEMEVIAEEYFEKLAMCSFIQDFERHENSDGKIISCKMHDIVHDFAQLMAKNDSFEIDGGKKLERDWQSAHHLHLKISKEMQCLEFIYHAINLCTLFLLSHERDYEFEMLLSNSFHHFRCLRTLILDCPIEKLPDTVENLIHLRCLHMSENVYIKELPETLCNLYNLQTLYIENSYGLKKLPQGMSKLINLRHLIFDENSHLVFPKGVGKLIDLGTLWVFNIGDKDDREGCKFGELKNLNQLRGTLRINGLENVVDVGEVQNAQLKKKIHLRGLVLWFSPLDSLEDEEDIRRMENDILVLNALEPPPHLQDLEIGGYMGNIIYPNWMMSCTTLKRLQLLRCVKLEHLPSLGQLPFLEVLKISWLLNVKKVGDEFLGIEDSKNKKDYWEEWIGMGETGEEEEEKDNGIVTNPILIKIMPRLQSLKIFRCYGLKSLPNYLKNSGIELKERYQKGSREYWHFPNIILIGSNGTSSH
ncbi:putative disease resistance RPP13-like protein 1 [Quercus robur]|uniref:putative disease resistance RPP13-like protein 1 n=1 Tax=Quercus robur TaxID=38942 RepID=UPI002161A0FD|nr:putative disease resistance RPP13-like protein 1 [Quercus robur]